MIINYEDVEAEELFKLPVDERKRVIDLGVDLLFQQVIITAKMLGTTPSKLLNQTLAQIEENIKYHTENDNFELCYYFTEVFWECNNRLENLRKDKNDGLWM